MNSPVTLLWIALLVYLFATLFPRTGFQKTLSLKYERMLHPYSGLDPDEWEHFKRNIRAFENEEDVAVSARQLKAAIENVYNIALNLRRSDDSENQTALESIARDLTVEGEYQVYISAQKKGLYFFPRYLNEYDEVQLDDLKSGHAIGNHFPDPKSHGQ
jgi:hypothetical protein